MVFTASLLEIPHQRGSVKHQMAEWYGASASGLVDLGFDSESGQTNDFKLVFTASLLDVQHLRDSVENKPASLLVVPLGKALNGIPPS